MCSHFNSGCVDLCNPVVWVEYFCPGQRLAFVLDVNVYKKKDLTGVCCWKKKKGCVNFSSPRLSMFVLI